MPECPKNKGIQTDKSPDTSRRRTPIGPAPVDALPQHRQLGRGQAHRAVARVRPWKAALLEHLVIKAEALLAPLALGPMAIQWLTQ